MVALAAFGLLGELVVARLARESDRTRERRRIVEAIDSERLRIQRDLHDTAQQRIVSVRIRLGSLAETPQLDRSAIRSVGHELDAALAEIRAVTVSNSPDLLWRDGLPAALRRVAARAPLPVLIESPDFGRLAPQVERQLYFSCLEALQNVFKHAGARHAWIRLSIQTGQAGFEIVDDGRGFDLARVTIGQGLRNISYRLSSLGGRLSIGANPGGGTRIRGEVPIPGSAGQRRRLLAAIHLPPRPGPGGGSRASAHRARTRRSGTAAATGRAAPT